MNVYDKNFEEEIIHSEQPVLVEFWASWCVPCQMMDYILNELKEEYKDKIKIAKLNIDRNSKTPKLLKLTGVPTFTTFKYGKIIQKQVGALSKNELIKMIEKVLI